MNHVRPSACPRLVFHVGPHKTGSTYIQVNLARAQGALRDLGVDFPDEWREGHAGHFHLFRKLKAGYDAEVESDFASIFARGASTVVLSSEDISDLNPEQLELLRKVTRGRHVEIVFYLRRWSDVIPSSWKENVKHGLTAPFVDWIFEIYADPRAFSNRINNFAKVFGKDAIRVVSFSNLVDAGVDLFDHFVEKIVGLRNFNFPNASRAHQNISLAMETTELIRLLNLIGVTRGARQHVIDSRSLGDFVGYSQLMRAISSSLSPIRIDDSTPAFKDLYRELNAEFGGALVSPEFGEMIFTCKSRTLLTLRREAFFAKELDAEVLKKFRDQLEGIALAQADS
jgi:hypothetical protein